MLGLGLGTQALALQRYKAKAKADMNEPHCHRTFLGNVHRYLLRFTDVCVHLYRLTDIDTCWILCVFS